jgi:plastocyanin
VTRRKTYAQVCFLSLGFFWLLGWGQATAEAQEKPFAEIRGRIILTGRAETGLHHAIIPDRYPRHGAQATTHAGMTSQATEPRLPERAVVYLEGESLNGQKYPLPAQNPMLNQRNLQFHPQVLPILVGTTVDFPNRDNLFHNVFSYSQPKEFDLGRYPRDDSRSVVFNRVGLVRVYCDIHADMNATIIVLPHPFFATPGEDGRYALHQVPEGKYSIVLWVDRAPVERRSIEVRAGETVEIDFTD